MFDEKEKERMWYPLKSSQGNILSIREHLKKLRMIEIFLPVTKEPVVLTDGDIVIKETPWFDDIIFVRHSKSYIEELMHKDKLCSQLSFMIKKDDNGNPDIITIDDSDAASWEASSPAWKECCAAYKTSAVSI